MPRTAAQQHGQALGSSTAHRRALGGISQKHSTVQWEGIPQPPNPSPAGGCVPHSPGCPGPLCGHLQGWRTRSSGQQCQHECEHVRALPGATACTALQGAAGGTRSQQTPQVLPSLANCMKICLLGYRVPWLYLTIHSQVVKGEWGI